MKITKNLFIALAAILMSFNVFATTSSSNMVSISDNHCPDLIVSKLAVVKKTKNSIKYKYVIKNIGKAKANLDGPTAANHDNMTIQAFLSIDPIYDNSDKPAGGTILGVSPLGYLEPGATRSGESEISPAPNSSKYKYLILIVDWKKSLQECNENNNIKVIKLPVPCPDLIVSKLIVTNKTHDAVGYKYIIKNIGTQKVFLNKVAVQAYLSRDKQLDKADIPAGGRVLSTSATDVLKPNQTMTQTFNSNTKQDPFNYRYLLLKVDAHDNINECKETNNVGRVGL